MAESAEPAAAASVRVEFAPDGTMPDGRAVVPVEREGEMIWVVRKGEMSETARTEINHALQHIAHSGLWTQRWEDPQGETRSTRHPH